jgi:carboxyl-terminal processing protease
MILSYFTPYNKSMIISKRTFFVSLVSCLFILLSAFCYAEGPQETDEKRNKLIGYMLYKQLPSIHFSDKKVDDSLALAAFDLYIKQLDFQKRFLLVEDVSEL